MNFPNNKDFAFTIIDDTDYSNLKDIVPIYETLINLGFKTTRAIWPLTPKSTHFEFYGDTLENIPYRNYMLDLYSQGFEMALHSVSSGFNNRQSIIDGLALYYDIFKSYPKMQINHAHNPDNIYWGNARFTPLLSRFLGIFNNYSSSGHLPNSPYFWGDIHKKYIKYTRNFNFPFINTLQCDPYMPYLEKSKLSSSNYWFSCTDGGNLTNTLQLLSDRNLDELERKGGVCILYLHFSNGFSENGKINNLFHNRLREIASRNGWFVNASQLLDWLLEKKYKKSQILGSRQIWKLNFKYLINRRNSTT